MSSSAPRRRGSPIRRRVSSDDRARWLDRFENPPLPKDGRSSSSSGRNGGGSNQRKSMNSAPRRPCSFAFSRPPKVFSFLSPLFTSRLLNLLLTSLRSRRPPAVVDSPSHPQSGSPFRSEKGTDPPVAASTNGATRAAESVRWSAAMDARAHTGSPTIPPQTDQQGVTDAPEAAPGDDTQSTDRPIGRSTGRTNDQPLHARKQSGRVVSLLSPSILILVLHLLFPSVLRTGPDRTGPNRPSVCRRRRRLDLGQSVGGSSDGAAMSTARQAAQRRHRKRRRRRARPVLYNESRFPRRLKAES